MILDRKWSPKSTANDPERKIGRAWTQVSGSSSKFYFHYKKSDYKLNFTSQINTRIKTKWKKSFKSKHDVGRQHTTFTSCQNATCSNEFFLWRVDYTSEGKRFVWANVFFTAYFILRGHDTHFLQLLLFLVGMIWPLMQEHFLWPLLKCNAFHCG